MLDFLKLCTSLRPQIPAYPRVQSPQEGPGCAMEMVLLENRILSREPTKQFLREEILVDFSSSFFAGL